jgi:glycosyltransferase involved in cell wall biosynthesis
MKIVLATGIYPPEIGGPATYVQHLSQALADRQLQVVVIAYGEQSDEQGAVPIIRISRKGGPIMRWRRYAKALKKNGSDADIVYAFSSISAGVPMWLAKLKHPKKILRLGGDFLWERYTDRGGTMSLGNWYASKPRFKGMMNGVLRQFDHIIFSTAFEQELYERFYARLPLHAVIENALPHGVPVHHTAHSPFRLLFLGRFVSFKNLGSLILALKELPDMTLTIAGDGPLASSLKDLVKEQQLADRISFLPPQAGDSKEQLFLDHDLMVLPSYTEISPHVALEARAAGLPVLLTEETGLSRTLTDGTQMRAMRSSREIVQAVQEAKGLYEQLSDRASSPLPARGWDQIAEEHLLFFRNIQ